MPKPFSSVCARNFRIAPPQACYEVLTDDPSVRKQVDDIVFDLYGEENPRQLEEYQKTPKQGMTMGGM